ncbi:hypothetical protein DF219_00025 [Corynebacterium liangguodongii]|nr:hypothetical protein DF219_00025 [Corynebacterium liangguodongii]
MTRPDFNFDPEVQVLNSLLWSQNDKADAYVLDPLGEEDVFNPLHGQLFTAIKDAHTHGRGATPQASTHTYWPATTHSVSYTQRLSVT